MALLCARAKVELTALEYHLFGAGKWMGFDMADRLICAMDGPELWRTPDLIDIYNEVDLTTSSCALVAA